MPKALLLDSIPVVIYVVLLLWIGFKATRRQADEDEFLLGGRSLTIPAFVATLVSTWYGGILGIGEFVYSSGLVAWVVMGLPYYLFALLFAFFLAGKIRQADTVSIPDIMYRRYDRKTGLLSGIFIVLMTSPAPYILMLAVLLRYFFHFSLLTAIVVSAFFSMVYVYWGGFRSVVQTDKLQFIFMFAGFILLMFFLLRIDSPVDLFHKLDATHRSLKGDLSWQNILVWFFIASWTFIDPGFNQRCAAARTPQVARRGIVISVLFWFAFDTLTILSGLYAFVLLPNIEPLMAYPALANHFLPPFARGVFFVGLFATIMSTIDSYTFLSAMGIGRDIIYEFVPNKEQTESNQYVKIGLILTGIIAIVMAWLMPSIVEMWYNLGSLFIPPLLLPVLGAYLRPFKIKPSFTFVLMAGSFAIGLFCFIWGYLNAIEGVAQYPFGIEPFFPAMIFSLVVFSIAKLMHHNTLQL